jgi:prevent-host-death family protein
LRIAGRRGNFNIKLKIERGGPAMEKISMLQFRRDAVGVLRKVQQGRHLILTYRGKPVARLEPIRNAEVGPDDPFYSLDRLAAGGAALGNGAIDQIVYES